MNGVRTILFTFFLVLLTSLSAQIKEIGLPFVNNYSREVYGAGTQNWGVTQDADGVMYFANNRGLLKFDGTSWNLISLPNNPIVRSVNWIDNKLYAGGYNEFGYFSENHNGEKVYRSLSDSLPEEHQNFDEIWRVYPTKHGVVFQSFLRIFLIKDGEITVLSPKSRFGFSYYSNNNYFIVDREYGLNILTANGLQEVYSDPKFFKENEITFIINSGLNNYLIGTTNNGIFKFDGIKLSPWQTNINKRFKQEQIYTGLKLSTDQIAIGTIQNGLYVIDFEGRLIQHINRYRGLQNNTVLSMFEDNLGNLWLGLDNGIDALEVSLPITMLNYCYGIETTYASIVYDNILYIGTNQGLFAKAFSAIENRYTDEAEFRLVDGVVGQVWSLHELNGRLICGNNLGTFVVNAYRSIQISNKQGGWNYTKVPGRENFMLGGTYTGLQLFKYSSGTTTGWKEVGVIDGFRESSKELMFDENNNLWITHNYRGLYKLQLSEDLLSVENFRLYNSERGLPDLPYSTSNLSGNSIIVASDGIYSYNNSLDTFIVNDQYAGLLKEELGLTKIKEDNQGDIWYFYSEGMGVLRLQEDGTYSKINTPFKRIKNKYLASSFENIFVHNSSNVFIGSQEGTFHYNSTKQKEFNPIYKAFIGEISIKGRQVDSVIFKEGNRLGDYEIPFRYNSVSFHFLAPFYEAPNHIVYSYKLNGFDNVWSPWGHRTLKEYTNLHEGDYEFVVRAKNIYDNISEASSFQIAIKPPLYRSKGAYVLYFAIVMLISVLNFILFQKRVEKAKHKEKTKHKEELKAKEEIYLEGVKLSEREIERLENEKLLIEMRHKDMELANSTMHIIQKNKFLNKVKEEIHDLTGKLTKESNKYALRHIVKRIDRDIKNKQQWKVFDQYFDEVHEDFIKRLKDKYPELTPKDLRLCACLKMNISTKEIAPLMNISVRGVEISRYRLRKKLGIDRETNLTDYILGI